MGQWDQAIVADWRNSSPSVEKGSGYRCRVVLPLTLIDQQNSPTTAEKSMDYAGVVPQVGDTVMTPLGERIVARRTVHNRSSLLHLAAPESDAPVDTRTLAILIQTGWAVEFPKPSDAESEATS